MTLLVDLSILDVRTPTYSNNRTVYRRMFDCFLVLFGDTVLYAKTGSYRSPPFLEPSRKDTLLGKQGPLMELDSFISLLYSAYLPYRPVRFLVSIVFEKTRTPKRSLSMIVRYVP